MNRHDHRTPYAADNGVRFAPEVVEIEFVGVEAEEEFVPISAELAIAMAKTGGESQTEDEPDDPSKEMEEPIDLEDLSFELDGEVFDLGAGASG